MDDLLADFVAETLESLSELDLALLRLERCPDDQQTLSFIFRLLHSIKGTCGFLGLPRLERIAHAAENVLDKLRDRSQQPDPGGISLVLAATGCMRMIVHSLSRSGREPQGDDAPLIAALDDLAGPRAIAGR